MEERLRYCNLVEELTTPKMSMSVCVFHHQPLIIIATNTELF